MIRMARSRIFTVNVCSRNDPGMKKMPRRGWNLLLNAIGKKHTPVVYAAHLGNSDRLTS